MDQSNGRYAAFRARLEDSVLTAEGDTSGDQRRAALTRGEGGETSDATLPPAIAQYLDTVAQHAYRVRDEDLAALQRAGHSDNALFELTVAATVGAALARLDRGLAALRGGERT